MAAAAIAEADGTIGVEIDVRRGSRSLKNLSALGLRKGDGRVWDHKKPWGLLFGDKEDEGEKQPDGRTSSFSSMASDTKTAVDSTHSAGPKDGEMDEKKAEGQTKGKGKGEAISAPRVPPMSIVIFIVGSRGGFGFLSKVIVMVLINQATSSRTLPWR